MIENPLNVIGYIFKNRHNLNKWVKIYSVLWILWTITLTFGYILLIVRPSPEIDRDLLYDAIVLFFVVVLSYIPINFVYKLDVDEKITIIRNPLSALLSVFRDKDDGRWWVKIYSVLWILWTIFWTFVTFFPPEIDRYLWYDYVFLFISVVFFVVLPFIPIYWMKGIKIEKLINPKSLQHTTLHFDSKVYVPFALLLLFIISIIFIIPVITIISHGVNPVTKTTFDLSLLGMYGFYFGFCLWVIWHFYTVGATRIMLYRPLLKAKHNEELLFLEANYPFFNLNTKHILKTCIYFILFIFGVSVPIMELTGGLDLYKICKELSIKEINPDNVSLVIIYIIYHLFRWGVILLLVFSVFIIPSKLLLEVVNIRRFSMNEKTIRQLSLWSYIEEFIHFTAVFSLLLLIFKIKEGYYVYPMIAILLILIAGFIVIAISTILFYVRFSLKGDVEELIRSFKKEGILSENVNINQLGS